MKINLLLLCLYYVPVVYCKVNDGTILQLKDLTFDLIRGFMSFEMSLNEWEAMKAQRINFKGKEQSIRIDVKRELQNFVNTHKFVPKADELEEIQAIIYGAYHCTTKRYATLISYLQLKDLRQFIDDLSRAKTKVLNRHHDEVNEESVYGSKYLTEEFEELGIKYPLDFLIQSPRGEFGVKTMGEYIRTGEKKVKTVWESILKKEPKFEIYYDIFVDVVSSKNPNYKSGTVHGDLLEIVTVFNELIRLVDNSIVDQCSPHNNSFVRGFGSLSGEINEAFEQLLLELDALHEDDVGSKFYTDFSSPVSPVSPESPKEGEGEKKNEDIIEIENIRGSGCFLKQLKFTINHLEKNHTNTENAKAIYGLNKRRISKKLVVFAKMPNKTGNTKDESSKEFVTEKSCLFYTITIDKTAVQEDNLLLIEEAKEEPVNLEMVVSAPPAPTRINDADFMASFLASEIFPTTNFDTALVPTTDYNITPDSPSPSTTTSQPIMPPSDPNNLIML
ncbi:uncharacterized protein LOC126834573 [Adelges cooleyi]|uniref:uncharacterized protein LOC126834573 n=1 Tax=Adelges cooleyi TaxID=133065 RepID=UPI00217F7D80|nr:uncharacterized protein LOC126834573 [Adelges cooleyi]